MYFTFITDIALFLGGVVNHPLVFFTFSTIDCFRSWHPHTVIGGEE